MVFSTFFNLSLNFATIHQQNGQTRRNEKNLRQVPPSKSEPVRNRKYEQTKHKYWDWNCGLKTPNKQKSRTDVFTGKFYQRFREELVTILLKLFQKLAEEGTYPNSFHEATITLIPKSDKDTMKKENWKSIKINFKNKNVCKIKKSKKIAGQYHWWT